MIATTFDMACSGYLLGSYRIACVGLNELFGAVVLSIAPPYLRDRTDDKLFERRSIKISKLLEV